MKAPIGIGSSCEVRALWAPTTFYGLRIAGLAALLLHTPGIILHIDRVHIKGHTVYLSISTTYMILQVLSRCQSIDAALLLSVVQHPAVP